MCLSTLGLNQSACRHYFIIMNTFDLGALVRHRRQTLALTQHALAEIAGVSVHSLSDLESGKGNPTLSALNQVADALGLELRLNVRTAAQVN